MLQIFKRKTHYYQYFSTIYYSVCETCLSYHGQIFAANDDIVTPPLHDGCDCTLLKIDKSELKHHRELAERMEERANQELIRRKRFHEAVETLPTDPDWAFELFKEAGHHEFYMDEVAEHIDQSTLPLNSHPEKARELLKLFINLNRFQYDKERYGHIPPRMKADRIAHGERLIKSLFSPVEV